MNKELNKLAYMEIKMRNFYRSLNLNSNVITKFDMVR